MADSMRAAGMDPALVYAYERTHLIITADHREKPLASPPILTRDDALAEYRENHPTN